MTKRGIGFAIASALLLLLALSSGYSEIFFFASLCLLALLFSVISVFMGARRLRISQSLAASSVMQGEKVTLNICFNSGAILPVGLRMKVNYPASQSRILTDYILTGYKSQLNVTMDCPHRGKWSVGVEKARCEDIFGLFSVSLSVFNAPAHPLSVTVFPLLLDIPGNTIRPVDSADTKDPLLMSDHGDTFSDTRTYRDGDPLKRIHWKMSVRARALYTRQYEAPATRPVLIAVDTITSAGEHMHSACGYTDMAASAAASLALFYIRHGHAVRLIFTPDTVAHHMDIHTPEDFDEAYSSLAIVPFSPSVISRTNAIIDCLSADQRMLRDAGALYVITRFPEHTLIDTLTGMSAGIGKSAVVYLSAPGTVTAPVTRSGDMWIVPISCPGDLLERLGSVID